jgi:adenylate cyclase
MQVCLKKLNRKRAEEGAFMLGMGVGIAAGDVIAGNIGSDKRMEFTVIGDAVNTASRLQSIAASGKILVTNRILDKVEGLVEYSKLPPVPLKGKSEPMDVIEILHLKDAVPDSDAADPSIINLPLFDRKAHRVI